MRLYHSDGVRDYYGEFTGEDLQLIKDSGNQKLFRLLLDRHVENCRNVIAQLGQEIDPKVDIFVRKPLTLAGLVSLYSKVVSDGCLYNPELNTITRFALPTTLKEINNDTRSF